jgi:hypothetical protein
MNSVTRLRLAGGAQRAWLEVTFDVSWEDCA